MSRSSCARRASAAVAEVKRLIGEYGLTARIWVSSASEEVGRKGRREVPRPERRGRDRVKRLRVIAQEAAAYAGPMLVC